MSDIDGWLLESISVNDGVLGLVGFDDDRPMNVWSGPHYERALSQRLICSARVAAAEWALADVERRAASSAVVENSRGVHAAAKAEWGAWDAQVTRLTNARAGR